MSLSAFCMDCPHFCCTGKALQQIGSVGQSLQREAINHNHTVTNNCAVSRVTVIKSQREGVPCYLLLEEKTALAGSLLSKHKLILSHARTLMIPGNANQCPDSSVSQPLGVYLMSSLIHSPYFLLMSPWLCSGTHLWEAKIIALNLSSIHV